MPSHLPRRTYRMVVVPPESPVGPWSGQLRITDIGYFPRATGHVRERPEGCGEFVVMLCIHGQGWCRLGADLQEVPTGTLVLLPAGQPHAYGADPDDPWTLWWIHLAGAQLPLLQREVPWLAGGVRPVHDPTPFVRLMSRALAELEHGHDPARLAATSTLAWQLLGLLGETHAPQVAADDGVSRAIQSMREHPEHPHTIAGLAQIAGWSPSHFAARFKTATGLPPLDYLLRLRMERAAWLLDNSTGTIEDIATQLGYPDPFYFSRRFRTHHGCAPREWRRKDRG